MNHIDDLEKLNKMAFSFISMAQHNTYTGWKRKELNFKKHSIIFVSKGRGSLQINTKVYPLEKNKCFIFVPNVDLYFDTDPFDPLQYYEIDFDYTPLNEKQDEKGTFPFQGEISILNPIEVSNLVSELHKKEHQLIHLEQFRKNAIFYQFMYLIASQICNECSGFNIKIAIELTRKYMMNHYGQEITREVLANMVGFSADYFSRLFKKEVGVSPNEYLIQIRMNRAKVYLVNSNQRLQEIAKSVGYSDVFYFSRLFKKVVGVSPIVYVQKNKKRVVTCFARDVEALMALGTTPIAATTYVEGEFDTILQFDQSLKDKEVINLGHQETPNLEALLEVMPDLIILPEWYEIIDEVSKIAPTVKLDSYGWDRFEEIASILGKEAEAAVFKEKFEKNVQ